MQKNYSFSHGRSIMRLFLILSILVFGVSCTTSKSMVYLNDYNTDSIQQNSPIFNSRLQFETPIQKNDLLWISVGGPNSTDLVALNSAAGLSVVGGAAVANQLGGSQIFGFLVEADGCIKMPYVGKVKAEGLSRTQLEDTLRGAFSAYTKDPVVNIRFMNYRITVMGEVTRPGSFTLPNERLTILEAIGMAGDLTVMGKRDNVLVIREVNGKREIGRINLLSKDLLLSPYYYLRTNDVVYIEPTPARFFARERLPQFITLAASGLSLLLTAITITRL